jgi:predicted ATPase
MSIPPGPAEPTIGLAGRESEVFRLGAAWGAAARGRPALMLLAGAAGIGKTRLAAESVRLAGKTGGTVLAARCYESETSLFAQPVVEAIGAHAAHQAPGVLRQLAGDQLGVLAELVPQIGAVLGPAPRRPEVQAPGELSPTLNPTPVNGSERADAITGMLHAMAAREPVLLVVDDLQYAGRATVDLLKRAAAGTGTRLLVVATARPTEGAAALEALADVATRLDLGPLPVAAVRRLATDAGRADLAGRIAELTRGHPMYVAEALDSPDLPPSLADAVLGRIRRAGEPTGKMLRAAAVLGTSVDPATLARLVDRPLPVIARCCAAAVSAGLLATTGRRYEFASGTVREILYESTPHDVRIGYHRRAADLLGDRPEALAAHAAAGGDWGRAERAWRRAADDAARRGAHADAGQLLTRAAAAAARA